MIRARALDRLGYVTLLEPQSLSGETLFDTITRLLDSKKRKKLTKLNVHGVQNAAEEILEVAGL